MHDPREQREEAAKMEEVRPPQRGLEGDSDSIESDELIQQDGYDDEAGVGNPHGYWEAGDY